jgi:hypothetical protein
MNENEQKNQETTETTQTTTTPVAADALSPVAAGNPQTQTQAPVGDAQRIAELERELQQERVEKGRLRQTNDELRSAKEEIARLKAENARLAQRKPSDYLTDEERAELDDKQLAAIDKVVQGRVGDMSAAQKAENDRLREEIARRDANIAASAKAQFNAEVERLAPGLAAAVNEHAAEWQKWAASPRRAASVAAAFQQNDAATVAEFLQEFVQSKGIQANGDGIAARPRTSFSPTGGSHPVQTGERDTATYTVDQYSEAMRRAGDDLNAGRITTEQYRAIRQKFNTALNEGRIVPR